MAYDKIQVPADRREDPGQPDLSLTVPDKPIIPYIEGDGIGIDITPGDDPGGRTPRWPRPTAAGGGSTGWRSTPGRSRPGLYGEDVWLPEETLARGQGLRGLHQGAADHPGGRRHPLAQRDPAPGAGPLRLSAPGALLQRDAEPAEGARAHGHGDLPREFGGHLRRHRVAGRDARGPARSSTSSSGRWA